MVRVSIGVLVPVTTMVEVEVNVVSGPVRVEEVVVPMASLLDEVSPVEVDHVLGGGGRTE